MSFLQIYFKLVMLLIGISSVAIAQKSNVPIRFWGLQDMSGTVGIEGEYKLQDIKLSSSYSDELETSFVKGRLLLNTQSYFYHPNLIALETEFEYNPGTQKDVYLVLPDRSDINTGERARGLFTLLQTQPISLNGYINYSHLYTNREYTTNLETFHNGFGGGIRYRNKFAPLSVTYLNERIDQKELQTNRNYLTERQNIRANTEFSIIEIDEHRITYTFDDYLRQYFSSTSAKSKISAANLNSNFHFDSSYSNTLNSNISYSKNIGNYNYERFLINENLNLELQSNFKYYGNYSYYNYTQSKISTNQYTFSNNLEHQLFESLKTNLFYDYINSNQTSTEEIITTGGFGLAYTKKIPIGILSLTYGFRKRNLNNNNLTPTLSVLNEEQIIKDDQIILLNNPFVDINTITVNDVTGSIIYQEYLDYVILERSEFIEIQRINGGRISDGATVYINYVALGQPSYEYAINSNNVSSRLSLFNNLLEFYFRLNENSYNNIFGRDAAILKSISQRVYGTKIRYNFISAGIEFDDYNSNIIPYEATRYFITLSTRFTSSFSTAVSGNLKYIELLEETEKQEFHDLSGRIIYNFNRYTNFNLEASYRFQKGRGLDLNLSLVKGELRTQFRSIHFTLGLEGYKRIYIGEKRNYWGSFLRIERKF